MRHRVTFSLRIGTLALLLTSCADDGSPPLRDKSETDGATDTNTTGTSVGCAASPEALGGCVQVEGYDEDLQFIADIRNPGSPHWQAVQDLCFDRLTELGYQVQQHEYITGINILGRKLGATNPGQEVLIGAHYDHLVGCIGADDNATGVAGALEAARVLAQAEFDKTITIACWDQEEAGLVGSRAFAQEAAMRGEQFVVNFNFEMLGYRSDQPETQEFPAGFNLLFPDAYAKVSGNQFRGDFIALIADQAAQPFFEPMVTFGESVGLSSVVLPLDSSTQNLPDLRRSDHASFWDIAVPAIMITDTANFRNAAYHCVGGEDTVDRLDSAFATQVVAATVASAAAAAGLR